MRSKRAWLALPIALVVLPLPAEAFGQTASTQSKPAQNPFPYAMDEPKAKAFSLSKAGDYLDRVAQFWMQPNSCGACHANFAYLMARPLLGERPAPLVAETRQFLEKREGKPNSHTFDAESVAIAFALAWDDARAGGKLQQATRKALDRIWPVQRPDGTWRRIGCGDIMPAENDPHYAPILAALAVAVAPEGYARTAEAQDGQKRLRGYFAKVSPRSLHDQAMRLWAAMQVDGVMTTAERATTIKSLLATQRPDGGWSLAALSVNPAHSLAEAPSDGYGTAFVTYVLRQAGVSAARSEIARGVGWLRSNQRASGRWFTPSPAAGEPTEGGVGARDLYVQNLGTAFAVLALKAVEGTEYDFAPRKRRSPRLGPGLSLRDGLLYD